jgi:hypothetical protein
VLRGNVLSGPRYQRIFGTPNASPYVKDGINNYVVNGRQDAVNQQQTGTKAAAHYRINVGAGETATIRLRLSDLTPAAMRDPFKAHSSNQFPLPGSRRSFRLSRVNGNYGGPKVRDRLCQLIRQHQLDVCGLRPNSEVPIKKIRGCWRGK